MSSPLYRNPLQVVVVAQEAAAPVLALAALVLVLARVVVAKL